MLSQYEINQMLQEEIEKSVQLGFCLFPIRQKVGLIDGTGVYGRCLVKNGNAEVRVNRHLLNADKEEIRSVIIHEVLHAIKGSYGHDAIWKNAVAKFSGSIRKKRGQFRTRKTIYAVSVSVTYLPVLYKKRSFQYMSVQCNNIQEVIEKYPNVIIKENKVVYKRYDKSNNFLSSVIVPTDKFPLLNDDIHVFSLWNCEEITDSSIIKAIDTVQYEIGHCYENSDKVAKVLRDIGQEPRIYCGWCFVGEGEFPIHHCWVVLEDRYLIDLSADSNTAILEAQGQYSHEELLTWTSSQWREWLYDYAKRSKHYKNSERCVLGLGDGKIYVGCEASCGNDGILAYQALKRKFPKHESDRTVGNMRINPLQARMMCDGIMNV